MTLVASIYHLPPRVLPSIQVIEGGRPGTISQDGNGSQDLGVMQVNTRWVQPLAADTRQLNLTYQSKVMQAATALFVSDHSHGC